VVAFVREEERAKTEAIREKALTALAQEKETKRRAVAQVVARYRPMAQKNETLTASLADQKNRLEELEKIAHEAQQEANRQAALRRKAEAGQAAAENLVEKIEAELINIAHAILDKDSGLEAVAHNLLAELEGQNNIHQTTWQDDEDDNDDSHRM
jgi:predicted  nucleic acid-binding Zn-ribbon protein